MEWLIPVVAGLTAAVFSALFYRNRILQYRLDDATASIARLSAANRELARIAAKRKERLGNAIDNAIGNIIRLERTIRELTEKPEKRRAELDIP